MYLYTTQDENEEKCDRQMKTALVNFSIPVVHHPQIPLECFENYNIQFGSAENECAAQLAYDSVVNAHRGLLQRIEITNWLTIRS